MRARLMLLALALPMLLQAKSTGLLKDYDDYFEGVRLENGVVNAKATKAFSELSGLKREAEIKAAMRELDESLQNLEGPVLLRIDDGAGGSLWALPEGGRAPMKLESWDATKDVAPPDSLAGRWFTYIGVGAVLSLPSSGTSVNFGINYGVKLGTYLYRDFLDLGVNLGGNLNLGVSDYSTDTSTIYDLGAFSRVHVPIFGMLGASFGLEGDYSLSSSSSDPYSSGAKSSSSSSSASQGALLAGLSLFLPSGSIDFDARFSTTTTYNIGLTTFLGPSNSVKAAPEKAKAQPKKKVTRTPTPEPSPEEEQALPSPTATPRAAETQAPTSTAPPTAAPTAAPTSTDVPTSAPTVAPTAASTPDSRAEEEAKKLEAERKALADEKAKLAEERRQLEEDKKAAKAGTPDSGHRMKRSGFNLYGGIWDTKMGSGGLNTYGMQVNYGLQLFLGDFRAGFSMLSFHGEYQFSNNGGPGPGPSGNQSNPQFDATAIGGTLGYDWTFLRAASAQGFEMYLPIGFGVRQVTVQAGNNFNGGNIDAALGLGMRWRIADAFALDASARFHVPFMVDDMSDGSSSLMSGSETVTSNLEGPEFSLATNFYLW